MRKYAQDINIRFFVFYFFLFFMKLNNEVPPPPPKKKIFSVFTANFFVPF